MLQRLLDHVDGVLVYLSALAIFAMMLLVSADVLSRYFLNSPIVGAVEFTEEYLMVVGVFLALSWTFQRGGHIRVELIVRLLPIRWRVPIYAVGDAISGVLWSIIAVLSGGEALDAWSNGTTSSSLLAYPMAPAYIVMTLGSTALSIRLFLAALNDAGRSRSRETDK